MLSVSIIIPAMNEEQIIGTVVNNVHQVMKRVGFNYEIIVINDGSTDKTAAVAQEVGAKVISHTYNLGNGAAIKTGIRNAKGDVVVMMDADGQHDPYDIPKLLAHIHNHAMVVGARSSDSQASKGRNLANMIYNSLASYMCSHPIPDLTSGFRAVRTDIARRFLYLLPNTFSYPTTLTMSVFRSGHCVQYIPIKAAPRIGKSKINLVRDGVSFLLIIFKIAGLYSPLKIFVPASLVVILMGVVWYFLTILMYGPKLPPASVILIISGVLIFFMGLISEQIAQVHYAFSENGSDDNGVEELLVTQPAENDELLSQETS